MVEKVDGQEAGELMAPNRQRTKPTTSYKGSRKRMRLLILLMIGFVAWAGATFFDQMNKISAKKEQLAELDAKLQEAKEQNAAYLQEMERLNDPEYIGQIIRKDLQMIQPGETLYIESK